jgi:hypothetical protein
MSKRNGMWALVALMALAAVVIGFFAINGTTKEFVFTTAEAQALLNANLEKRALDEKTVNVESATVLFQDSKVIIDATVDGRKFGRKVRADVHAVGKPRYDKGAFYFTPTEKLVFSNLKAEKAQKDPGVFSKTKERAKEVFKKQADKVITKLGLEDEVSEWQEVADTFRSEFQGWIVGVAESQVEKVLTRRPIYTSKDDLKGFAIRAAVQKVEVVGDRLVVTVSLTQILYSIFIAIMLVLAAVALVVFLFRNPRFGLGVLSSFDT